ncbi:uncharacterized protein LOC123315803 [Coccinella septempunctata]|uniref:uncharacterized protein LOC123315803 n=1 Tax=Coccinella septempunctata TaxID=41139 RepID=UPI001D08FD7D|nr:uncharacterized protein LOC123315803 [Coccinella septempunctata]
MITFKITFLLSLNTDLEYLNERNNKFSVENKSAVTEDGAKKVHELKTGELITCLRIEYELLPKKFKYTVDVTCWRNVAKVSSPDGSRYYKILESDRILWIPICIHHFLKELTEDELVNLHSHIIAFNVTTTKKDVTSKLSSLYCLENEATIEKFVEYYEADPNKAENHHERVDETTEFLQISKKCATSDNIISWIRFTGKTHCFLVYDTISSVKKGDQIKCKYFASSSEITSETKQNEKSKTNKKPEEKKKDPYFIVPGEIFFTDPSMAIYELKEPNELLSAGFLFLSVENLMTREQKSSLNPFIVKINKLDRLPVDILEQHGYTGIFISYEIPSLVQYDSPVRPLSRTIYFNESHACLTKDLIRYKYLEFLRTQRVKVHIKGIREEENQNKPALFGTMKQDQNFSKRLQPREAFEYLRRKEMHPKVQTLAIATYDLSSLLKDIWLYKMKASCHHPSNMLHGITGDSSITLVDILTIPEINLANLDIPKNSSPLLDGILAAELTTLDMEFFFVSPQFANRHLQSNTRTYKRFFITFYDIGQAKHLLASILQHNQEIIGLNAVVIDPVNFSDDKVKVELHKRKMSKQQKVSDESLQNRLQGMTHDIDDVITGFMIDSGTEIYIFVEGISHGYILEIWNKIHKINISVAKVLLNSETEFGDRIYKEFMSFGIYSITLKMPLKEIFKNQDIYIQGLIPIPCSKALQKLQLLLQTESLSEMLRQELFPATNELTSFSLECGVPLRFCK